MVEVTTYVIAERSLGGEYWRGDRWTPARDEAQEFESIDLVLQVIGSGMDRDIIVLTREYDTWKDVDNGKFHEFWTGESIRQGTTTDF
jgi:hypothetical protein